MSLAMPARAVIVLGGRERPMATSITQVRTSIPAPGNLESYVGTWGAYLGTPIAPIISSPPTTSATVVAVDSISYIATAASHQSHIPRLWPARRTTWRSGRSAASTRPFTHYAPLYTGSSEVGLSMIDMGRGTPRGTVVNTPSTSNPAGWNWGSPNPMWSRGERTPCPDIMTSDADDAWIRRGVSEVGFHQ